MLDVHPPHAPAHTWKDFFIHIATICVGLLIAIGLEQSVEAVHHRQQRNRLEEDLLVEATQNIRLADNNFATDLPNLTWSISAMRALRDAPVNGGWVAVALPPSSSAPINYSLSGDVSSTPSHSVWTIALATGQVDLLPLNRAKVDDRLEREATGYMHIDELADIENGEFQAILRSLDVRFTPGESIHLAPAQRDELVHAVNKHLQMRYWDDLRLALWKGASEAVLHNVQTPDEVYSYMNKEIKAVPKP